MVRQLRYFKHKLTAVVTVSMTASSAQEFCFSRFDYGYNGGPGNPQWAGISTPPRWHQVRLNYEEFSVTGFKIAWIPNSLHANTTGIGLDSIVWIEDPDTQYLGDITIQEAVLKETFRMKDPNKPWSVYRNNRLLARQSDQVWRKTSPTNEELPSALGVSRASAMVKFQSTTAAVVASQEMGYLKYTYYVTFRGQSFQRDPPPPENLSDSVIMC